MPRFEMPTMHSLFGRDPFARASFASPFGSAGLDGFGSFGSIENGLEQSMHNMERRMHDVINRKPDPHGESASQSFSSSYSSERNGDGEVHEQSNKDGSSTRCHNGVCKTTTCKDGKCTEQVTK